MDKLDYVKALRNFKNENTNKHPTTKKEASVHKYKFWNSQPVSKLGESNALFKSIDSDLTATQEQHKLNKDFYWKKFDRSDINNISNFLKKNYSTDNHNEFRLTYDKESLEHLLFDFKESLNIGVCVKKNDLIVGFISSRIIKMQTGQKQNDFSYINFLCVHSKLRGKRLAPVLIKEITRIIVQNGIDKAIYSSHTYLPTPSISTSSFHRPLNTKILLDTGFTNIPDKVTHDQMEKAFTLNDNFRYKYDKMKKEEIITIDEHVVTILNQNVLQDIIENNTMKKSISI